VRESEGRVHIEKLYFSLPEVQDRWRISETDLVYLAENDKLRLSVRVFHAAVEFGDFDEGADGERFRVPWERKPFSGLLDLHACDVFQLFRCGELHVSEFRTPRADYAALYGEAEPIFVLIGDLLLRRDERDRFELQSGFSSGGSAIEESTFIASTDFQDVRCNGYRFRLGPIQAQVVRALHEAALRGEAWQSGKAILSSAGSKSLRMADVFKSQQDWRELIRSDRRGGYRLNVD